MALGNTVNHLKLDDTAQQWLRDTVLRMIENDRAFFYAQITPDSEQDEEKTEVEEQIQTKLETIIEHYINNRKR